MNPGEWMLLFTAGIVGSLHCVGMCGGFPLLLTHGIKKPLNRWGSLLLYGLGKTSTYALLGGLIAGSATLLSLLVSGRRTIALLMGSGLILIGVAYLLRQPSKVATGIWAAPGKWLSKTISRLVQARFPGHALLLGIANGFLPCPLVMGMLMMVAGEATVRSGALSLAVFGLGTLPALFAIGWVNAWFKPSWRRHINIVMGLLFILVGIATLVRSDQAMHHHQEGNAMHVMP